VNPQPDRDPLNVTELFAACKLMVLQAHAVMGNGRIRLLPSAKPIARLIDDRAVFQEAQLSPRDRAMRRVS